MARRSKGKGGKGGSRGEFLAGLVLGLVLALWVYPMLTQWWSEPHSQAVANDPFASPRFDFYDILERGEELVEEAPALPTETPETPAQAANEPPAGASEQPSPGAPAASGPDPQASGLVATPGTYLLQMGAFTRQRDAEALRARLALVGIDATVRPVRKNQQVIYRVRTRPTSDLERLNANRARLQEHRIHYFRIRLAE